MLKILTLTALLSSALAGLAVAHSNSEEPVTCTPAEGPNYPGTYTTRAAAGRTFYIIAKTPSDAAKELNDANKAEPLSIWMESNNVPALQWKDYVCTYADGHTYDGSVPSKQAVARDTTAPVWA